MIKICIIIQHVLTRNVISSTVWGSGGQGPPSFSFFPLPPPFPLPPLRRRPLPFLSPSFRLLSPSSPLPSNWGTGWPSGSILVQTNCLDITMAWKTSYKDVATILPSSFRPLPFPPLEVGQRSSGAVQEMKHQTGGLGGRVVTYLCKQTVWTSQWHGRRLVRMWRRVWLVLHCIFFAWGAIDPLPSAEDAPGVDMINTIVNDTGIMTYVCWGCHLPPPTNFCAFCNMKQN